jgi:hypothetical protein
MVLRTKDFMAESETFGMVPGRLFVRVEFVLSIAVFGCGEAAAEIALPSKSEVAVASIDFLDMNIRSTLVLVMPSPKGLSKRKTWVGIKFRAFVAQVTFSVTIEARSLITSATLMNAF